MSLTLKEIQPAACPGCGQKDWQEVEQVGEGAYLYQCAACGQLGTGTLEDGRVAWDFFRKDGLNGRRD